MTRVFILLLLFSSVALATPSQDAVKQHFTTVLETEMRAMLTAQINKNPNHPDVEKMRQDMDATIQKVIPDAFKAFSPELDVTEAQADALMAEKPNKEANSKAIRANVEQMNRSPLPKPVLVTTMLAAYEKNADQDEWFLEVLQRLTAGTVRQLKERGEL